jgi:hypothetical protein
VESGELEGPAGGRDDLFAAILFFDLNILSNLYGLNLLENDNWTISRSMGFDIHKPVNG